MSKLKLCLKIFFFIFQNFYSARYKRLSRIAHDRLNCKTSEGMLSSDTAIRKEAHTSLKAGRNVRLPLGRALKSPRRDSGIKIYITS